ncbi:hypothetical protein [Streptomyces sp. UNOC14_S4]|uniref:hypothetical protein n=1 Tax=Streptomyces sp. UNOC14_S4 TaxID=2872340 RepID=UPI001E3E2D60|nr:hypothetical protein [Streptomyces sp. UNOC14_S4]MCC3769097.1 hypothetical protein [Streptomyces sp. UNOC14_S4]
MATTVRLLGGPPDRDVLTVLDRRLRRLVWHRHATSIRTTIQRRDLPGDRLRLLGRWCATRGEHPNTVAFGMTLLGLRGTDDDRDTLLSLGVHSAFAKEACVALAHSQAEPDRALLALARRSVGWSRVHAVEALAESDDPVVMEWLVRESCTGDVLDAYAALAVAKAGDLAGVLAHDSLDENMLDGAARVLHALTDLDAPVAALASYPGALRAVDDYVRHVAARGPGTWHVRGLARIDRYLGSTGARRAPWPPDDVRHVRSRLRALLPARDS